MEAGRRTRANRLHRFRSARGRGPPPRQPRPGGRSGAPRTPAGAGTDCDVSREEEAGGRQEEAEDGRGHQLCLVPELLPPCTAPSLRRREVDGHTAGRMSADKRHGRGRRQLHSTDAPASLRLTTDLLDLLDLTDLADRVAENVTDRPGPIEQRGDPVSAHGSPGLDLGLARGSMEGRSGPVDHPCNGTSGLPRTNGRRPF